MILEVIPDTDNRLLHDLQRDNIHCTRGVSEYGINILSYVE